ncbi:MAG: ribosome maturation factor RimP [Syntrophales bacterium]|jgi:ribosome maturation factor RimP|nr:ribosome maturation factor RimP [Syntrophales bacterium]MCU0583043.1 ribosome maturation factor RimP [Syntrophales bacterium]
MPETATYRERIIELIEPAVESEGLELVELECLRMKTRWLVRIFIDREGGATLDDCTAVSHQAGDLLNVHDLPPGPYTLEVSTPGLDRPLTRDKDFEKYRGARVRIRTREPIEGSRNFLGTFVEYTTEGGRRTVTVDVDGRIVPIDRENIQKANLEYERPAAGAGKKAPGKGKKP